MFIVNKPIRVARAQISEIEQLLSTPVTLFPTQYCHICQRTTPCNLCCASCPSTVVVEMGWTASILMLSHGSDHASESLLIFPTKTYNMIFAKCYVLFLSPVHFTIWRWCAVSSNSRRRALCFIYGWHELYKTQSALDEPKVQIGILFGVQVLFRYAASFVAQQ